MSELLVAGLVVAAVFYWNRVKKMGPANRSTGIGQDTDRLGGLDGPANVDNKGQMAQIQPVEKKVAPFPSNITIVSY